MEAAITQHPTALADSTRILAVMKPPSEHTAALSIAHNTRILAVEATSTQHAAALADDARVIAVGAAKYNTQQHLQTVRGYLQWGQQLHNTQ